jgi:hypothetical protein
MIGGIVVGATVGGLGAAAAIVFFFHSYMKKKTRGQRLVSPINSPPMSDIEKGSRKIIEEPEELETLRSRQDLQHNIIEDSVPSYSASSFVSF